MRRRLAAALAVVACVVASGLVAGRPAGATAEPEGPRVVVRVDGGAEEASDVAAAAGADVVGQVSSDTFVLSPPTGKSRLDRLPGVVWAEAETLFHAADRVPNDECWVSCFGVEQDELASVGAPEAWGVSIGDPGVRVAVLDTGVDVTHPDLDGQVDVGPGFVTEPTSCPAQVRDQEAGHGTGVASLIAATTDNLTGMAGLGWRTRVASFKVLDDCGFGRSADISAGIRAAADAGIPVLNLSFSSPSLPQVVAEAINHARSRGSLIVAAVGNDGGRTPQFPADYPGVIGVAASDHTGQLLPFSNRGRWADLSAPGNEILIAVPGGGFGLGDGTSFSAPLVSATAALLLAAEPGLGAAGVARRLVRTARPLGVPVDDVTCGGLDAGAALTGAPAQTGYAFVARDGGTFTFGDARFHGSAAGAVRAPVTTMAWAPTSCGYWTATAAGEVLAFGGADALGDLSNEVLNRSIVGMAPTPTGDGYWLVASDGGVFTFGDAGFFGSAGDLPLNQPIVGMAPTVTGRGYWLVAADGGIFAFGDATFFGSTGSLALNRPVVGMTPSPSGAGYWFVASDGGIFAFGDARFFGSTGSLVLNRPVVGMAAVPDGDGYWLVASDGGVFAFGDAPFLGSAGSIALAEPIVGMAAF